MSDFRNYIGGAFESLAVSDQPCDGLDGKPCGVTGSTKLYADGHIFQLCPECAWTLTEQYRKDGHTPPWETPERQDARETFERSDEGNP